MLRFHTSSMKILAIVMLGFLTSCAAMLPQMFQTIDDVATDTAVKVEVDKSAMQKGTNVHIDLSLVNTLASE